MTKPSEPDINAYGTYGRVEAVADWIELAARARRRVTKAQLETAYLRQRVDHPLAATVSPPQWSGR